MKFNYKQSVLICTCLLALTSNAYSLTFIYEGIITSASYDDPEESPGFLARQAAFASFLGQVLRFEYTFDETIPDTILQPNIHSHSASGISATFSGNSNVYSGNSGIIQTWDNVSIDQYLVRGSSLSGPGIGGFDADEITADLRFEDITQTIFDDANTPTIQPNAIDFTSAELRLSFETFVITDDSDPDEIEGYYIEGLIIAGGVNNIQSVSSVPLPAAVWLFLSAITGLFGFNRRKKNNV